MKSLVFENITAFKQMKGRELPVSSWMLVTQKMINDFANATLDKQWVHIDEERAKKESPFKSTIAHGFMSVALISKLLNDSIKINSVTMALNYGLNHVRFMNPVPVNSQINLACTVKDIEDYKNGIKVTFLCTVAIKGKEKPACVAEFLALFFE